MNKALCVLHHQARSAGTVELPVPVDSFRFHDQISALQKTIADPNSGSRTALPVYCLADDTLHFFSTGSLTTSVLVLHSKSAVLQKGHKIASLS